MARRSTPAPPQLAQLSPAQMKAAIPRLQKRIEELRAFDPDSVDSRSDAKIEDLETAITDTLQSIFGPHTAEFMTYRSATVIDTASSSMMGPTPMYEVREGLRRGVERSIALLSRIITSFKEQMGEDDVSTAGRAAVAFGNLDLHPDILRATEKLYREGNYAHAVEDACKTLNLLVKMRSGRDDQDGSPLMQLVFSPKAPILAFNDLNDETDRSEQQGMMFLFSGAMAAFRNPRAHKIVKDDAERALEYIAFISLLAKLLDEARRV